LKGNFLIFILRFFELFSLLPFLPFLFVILLWGRALLSFISSFTLELFSQFQLFFRILHSLNSTFSIFLGFWVSFWSHGGEYFPQLLEGLFRVPFLILFGFFFRVPSLVHRGLIRTLVLHFFGNPSVH